MSEPILLSPETYGRMLRSIKETESRTSVDVTPTQVRRNPKKAVYLVQLTAMTAAANPKIWDAIQVYLDTDGLPVASANTIVFDEDNPVFTVVDSAAGEVLEIARKYRPSGGDAYWLALKSAGGGEDPKVRLKVKATATSLNGDVFLCDIIDNAGAVITVDVDVKQKKFASAKFYINEIIYGDPDGANYLADAYLAGIGVG